MLPGGGRSRGPARRKPCEARPGPPRRPPGRAMQARVRRRPPAVAGAVPAEDARPRAACLEQGVRRRRGSLRLGPGGAREPAGASPPPPSVFRPRAGRCEVVGRSGDSGGTRRPGPGGASLSHIGCARSGRRDAHGHAGRPRSTGATVPGTRASRVGVARERSTWNTRPSRPSTAASRAQLRGLMVIRELTVHRRPPPTPPVAHRRRLRRRAPFGSDSPVRPGASDGSPRGGPSSSEVTS